MSSSTASEHLEILVNAGLVDRAQNGREVAVSLAGPEAASLVERLVSFSDVSTQHAIDCSDVVQSKFRPNSKMARIALARTCYDHLAGRLGVAFTDFLLTSQLVDTNLAPTTQGHDWFSDVLDVNIRTLISESERASSRPLVRSCIDWTERKPHLAGRLGAAIATSFTLNGWVTKHPDDRSLRITPAGRIMLEAHGIHLLA